MEFNSESGNHIEAYISNQGVQILLYVPGIISYLILTGLRERNLSLFQSAKAALIVITVNPDFEI